MQGLVDWDAVLKQTADMLQPPNDVYYDDPELFCEEVLGVTLRRYQRRILRRLKNKEHRLCVRSLHGTGKSALAAMIILWFAITRERRGVDWKVVATASVWRQLTVYLFPEVRKWARNIDWSKLPEMQPWRDGQEILTLQLKGQYGLAAAVASDEATSIEGAHATELLFLFDEAKAIASDIFDAAEGALATLGTWACVFSTPGDTSGRFYDIQRHAPGTEDWKTDHFTLEEALAEGAVTEAWVEQRRKQWGENSQLFQNRVLGKFAKQGEDSVIALDWVEAAQLRWHDYVTLGPPSRISVDVARSGNDKTCIGKRRGQYLDELDYHHQDDTMATVGNVRAAVGEDVDCEVWVDIIGIGAGVFDRLRELGYNVVAFNAGEKSELTDTSGELTFRNKRAAMWWTMRDILDPANKFEVALPPDDILTGDLTAPRWKMTSAGIQVESKDELKKRLGRSTDAGDACVMAFVPRESSGDDFEVYDDYVTIGADY